MRQMIAMCVAQPYAELIVRGVRTKVHHKVSTTKRERVYVYAKAIPGPAAAYRRFDLRPEDLPSGLLIGTVEIVDCEAVPAGYTWRFANPQRLDPPMKAVRVPQPLWFYPFWQAIAAGHETANE